jgi:uncharacterized Zn-finger protein
MFQDPGKVLDIFAWAPPDPDSFLVLSEGQDLRQAVAGIHLGVLGKPLSFPPHSEGIHFGSHTTLSCSLYSSRLFQLLRLLWLLRLPWPAWILRLLQLC